MFPSVQTFAFWQYCSPVRTPLKHLEHLYHLGNGPFRDLPEPSQLGKHTLVFEDFRQSEIIAVYTLLYPASSA